MARIGYKYYIIVNSTTGKFDTNCGVCQAIRSSTSQPTPTGDASHNVLDISKVDYNLMVERDNNGGYKRKWDTGQGKPVDDT